MNIITNSQPRRISMAYFAGLFLLALTIPCVAFIKSVKLNATLSAKEMAELREKERIFKSFADMSDALRAYQTAQTTKDPRSTELGANCKTKIENLFSDLRGKDTSNVYSDIRRSLQTADQHFQFLQRYNIDQAAVNPMIAQLQQENGQLKTQLMLCGQGKPCPQCPQCPPPRVEYVATGGKPCPPCPEATPGAAPCNCDRECQTKVLEYKQKINPTLISMNSNLNNIRNTMKDIDCLGGLLNKYKKEKASIDRSLTDIEKAVSLVSAQ